MRPPFRRALYFVSKARKGGIRIATTFIKPYKAPKGRSAIDTMKDRFDYGLDPKKCAATSSYLCDPKTAYAEFRLTKSQYEVRTGRSSEKGHLFFQIRQAFPAGEVTVEEAQRIGYETAMRWTKGHYQFFVCTHTNTGKIHNHIYYNATAEDGTRKFHNFIGSSFAVRRLSDRICLEHNLSVVVNPKQHSQSKFKHYGQWLGETKPPSLKEQLKATINQVLRNDKPKDLDAFFGLMKDAGYEHKWGRGGVLSFRAEGQEKFTRLRQSTLGVGYSIDDIKAVIEGRKTLPVYEPKPAPRKVSLVIDIQEKLRDGKGPAYTRWATVFNLKQMAAALQYLQENKLQVYGDLVTKAETVTERFHAIGDKLKATESALKQNNALRKAITDYARTRSVFEEYKAQKYSNKYLAEHEDDIAVYRAAQAAMRALLHGEKLPKMDALKAEWQMLESEKKAGYSEYRNAQTEMREIIAVKANIDHLLGLSEQDKAKETER